MTNAGLDAALDFLAGVCPTQEQTEEMVKAWRLKLDKFDDETVMQALWNLAEHPRYRIDLGEVHDTALSLRNRKAIAADQQRREELAPFGRGNSGEERDWNQLTDTERQQWVDKAADHWETVGFPIKRDSPILEASAAAMCRGVTFTPPPVGTDRYDRCGCGAALLAIDPPGGRCRNCEGSGRKATM